MWYKIDIQSRRKIAILVIFRLKVGKIYQNRPKCYGWSKICSKVFFALVESTYFNSWKKTKKIRSNFYVLVQCPKYNIKSEIWRPLKNFPMFFQPCFRQKWPNSSLYISNSYESECAISAKFWVKVKILAKNRILGENLAKNGSNLGP